MSDDRINRFTGPFYEARRPLMVGDLLDEGVRPTTRNNYLLKVLERKVTLGHAESAFDVHVSAERHHRRQVDQDGPKAVAGRPDALHPILLNRTTGRQEPKVMQHMNDRLACRQEITSGLCIRTDDEIELVKLLQERGLIRSNDDDEEELIG